MKHKVKVDVVTEKPGFFGPKKVIEKKTITVSGRDYRKLKKEQFRKAVRDSGGLALKFISPNLNGVPDRLLLFMGGKMAFAEVKAPGEKPRPLQVHRMEQLQQP